MTGWSSSTLVGNGELGLRAVKQTRHGAQRHLSPTNDWDIASFNLGPVNARHGVGIYISGALCKRFLWRNGCWYWLGWELQTPPSQQISLLPQWAHLTCETRLLSVSRGRHQWQRESERPKRSTDFKQVYRLDLKELLVSGYSRLCFIKGLFWRKSHLGL